MWSFYIFNRVHVTAFQLYTFLSNATSSIVFNKRKRMAILKPRTCLILHIYRIYIYTGLMEYSYHSYLPWKQMKQRLQIKYHIGFSVDLRFVFFTPMSWLIWVTPSTPTRLISHTLDDYQWSDMCHFDSWRIRDQYGLSLSVRTVSPER